jgi:hypothetical protein
MIDCGRRLTSDNELRPRCPEMRFEANGSNGALLERTMSEAPVNQRHQVPAELLLPLSLKPWTKLLLLIPGGPRSKTELQKLQDDVANRFEGQWEHAVEYINKRHDRFLNKARGLLTFDGLVLAALSAVYRAAG